MESEESTAFEKISQELHAGLEEFFAPTTTNERKHQIEIALLSFQNDYARSIPLSIQLLSNSQHQYTLMFALHVLQAVVGSRWLSLTADSKARIRHCCVTNLDRLHSTQPQFISNKLMKVMADIGRLDWPQFYPDFFTQLLQWISSPSTVALGLKMLKITLEEFLSVTSSATTVPSDDCLLLSADQREAQRLHLLQETEQRLLSPVLTILQSTFERYAVELSARLTPDQLHQMEWTSFVREACSHMGVLPRLSSHLSSYQASYLALSSLNHFAQFYPLATLVDTPKFLDFLYAWALSGCRPSSNSSAFEDSVVIGDDDLSTVAMSGLLELTGRHFVPIGSSSSSSNQPGDHRIQLERLQIFRFLDLLLTELSTLDKVKGEKLTQKLAALNPSWLSKTVELVRLFFTYHFHRYDSSTASPSALSPYAITEFLTKLWMITEHLPTVELFQNALDIWQVFFDYLHAQLDSCKIPLTSQAVSQKYSKLFDLMIGALLKKISTEENGLDLADSMDLQFADLNNDDSEWSHYLLACCDLLAKIADMYPLVTFRTLRSSFDSHMASFVRFQYQASHPESVIRQFQDLEALLVAMGRLSHLFINETFWKYLDECKSFVNKLCEGILYCSKCKYYKSDDAPGDLRLEFAHVYAQLLLCLRNYCHWLAQLYAEAQRSGEYNAEASTIISTAIDALVPLFETVTPKRLLQAAVSTLYSVLITVRPQSYLLSTESMKKLYAKACQLEYSGLPPEIYRVLYGSLCNYLILPWFNAVNYEQEWEQRKPMYQKLMRAFLHEFDQLCQLQQERASSSSAANWSDQRVKKIIQDASELLIEMLESIANESTKTKQLCYGALKHAIGGTLRLIGATTDRADFLEPLLALISAAFNSLMVQLGPDFTKETVERFLQLCEANQFKVMLGTDSSAACKVLEHILKILHCIVKEMSKAFSVFTESILTLLFRNLHPIMGQIGSVDVKQAFYSVLFLFLDIRWRYFFATNVLMSMENQEVGEKTDHTEQLLAIMQAFGESLSDGDPSVIKQNLSYLNSLNTKWAFYRRAVFANQMFPHYVHALMQLLSTRTHPILFDDFVDTLAQMSCASDSNLHSFRFEILPQFLTKSGSLRSEQIESLLSKAKFTKEVPPFTLEFRRLLVDVVMYSTCNASAAN